MSYKKLDIWKQARVLVVEIHHLSIRELPKFELYEVGSQIRRSMKSVKANIVEGYGRRQYKGEFLKFITYAIASTYETIDHLETLYETGSLSNQQKFETLHKKLTQLSWALYNFHKALQTKHIT
ncbi:MAG: four helix bundle protein [Phaeodactylibacter sp.]|nr:four helix bundle protein [Phaeodactylibacter sp.]